MGNNEIKVPQSRAEAVGLVINALTARNNRLTFRDGANVVYLNTLHDLLEKSSVAEQLLTDFKAIVEEAATSFAAMGFVPIVRTEVRAKAMTLTIYVDKAVSTR